ncbi:glycosyltransferase family A protein [Flavobacterium sp. 245]|uniref:glycosyltransferase family A protein n=1 Tax=Flavobacterium sp. 245 TaxID=2512115 RepID=UPI0010601C8A|nr:glycosyltransferase family 2 protein [Flavobacterium sp. 245]TDP00869.1 glycosyltransferase involved in cell wall biosynthesis [Flavobacterium sp. 245]
MKKLAVLMPTYNCAKYLSESIDSIVNQTYSDFDLYIYDDCSTDNSTELIENYNDDRIFYRKNEANLGISKTLNIGLEELLGNYEFIARMDADDWAYPNRFQMQMDFMEQNPDVNLCGTQGFWLKNMGESPTSGWQYPVSYNYIRLYLLFTASFGHSSLFFRSSFFIAKKLRYNDTIKTCEDWDLWIRVSAMGEVHNLPDFLMKYRIISTSNHRSEENKTKHFIERSKIISNYWKTFDSNLSPEQVLEYYYESNDSLKQNFIQKLKILINSFNQLFVNHTLDLQIEDKKKFNYLLARKIVDYRKRAKISLFNPFVWFLLLTHVKFISMPRLIKSQIN